MLKMNNCSSRIFSLFLIITFSYKIRAKFLLIELEESERHENIGVQNETTSEKLNETELQNNQTKGHIGKSKHEG